MSTLSWLKNLISVKPIVCDTMKIQTGYTTNLVHPTIIGKTSDGTNVAHGFTEYGVPVTSTEKFGQIKTVGNRPSFGEELPHHNQIFVYDPILDRVYDCDPVSGKCKQRKDKK